MNSLNWVSNYDSLNSSFHLKIKSNQQFKLVSLRRNDRNQKLELIVPISLSQIINWFYLILIFHEISRYLS